MNVEQALAGLPDTADGIAAYLIEQQCPGEREDGQCCPLANYLHRTSGSRNAFVDFTVVLPDGREGGGAVVLPVAFREFISRFDEGEWPELDIDRLVFG